MYICFTASRLKNVSEVREICEELRNNPDVVKELELAAKKELFKRFGQKEKAAS
jgi:hypothetical protein